MIVYFLNILVITIIAFFIYRSSVPKKYFLKLSFSYLFFISSFRDKTIGADHAAYVDAFNYIKDNGSYYMEAGYVLLNKLVCLFTDNYVGISIAVNLMLFIPLYYYFRDYIEEKNWPFVTVIFASHPYLYLQTTFNAMRQCCAIGIIMLGFVIYLKYNGKIRSLIIMLATVLLAAQFHKTSYLALAFIIVLYFPWKKIHWWLLLGASLIINTTGSSAIDKVASLLGYSAYLGYDNSMLNNIPYKLLIITLVIYVIKQYDSFESIDSIHRKLLNIYIFSLCFLIVALSNDMFYRCYIIFAFLALPSIPMICDNVKGFRVRVRLNNTIIGIRQLYYMYYLSFYFGYILLLHLNQNTMYVPFKFCF